MSEISAAKSMSWWSVHCSVYNRGLYRILIIHLFQNNSSWRDMCCFINDKNSRKYIIRNLRYRSYIWESVFFRKSLLLKKTESQNVWSSHIPSVAISLCFSYLDSFWDTSKKVSDPCPEFRASTERTCKEIKVKKYNWINLKWKLV